MEIGILSRDDLGIFRSLLLPDAANALSAGEPVTALGLTQDDVAVGALAGYLENNRFQIISLYVAEDYRRCGGGRMLLETLFDILDNHAFGVEISFSITQEEHQTLFPFLEVMGFQREEDQGQTLYLTALEEIVNNPFFAVSGKKIGKPFSQLESGDIVMVKRAVTENNAPIPEGGILAETIEQDLSLVCFNENKVEAFLIFETDGLEGVRVSAVWSGSKKMAVLAGLLRSAVLTAKEKYPLKTSVAVQAVNSTSASLIQKLLPEAKISSHTYYRAVDSWQQERRSFYGEWK